MKREEWSTAALFQLAHAVLDRQIVEHVARSGFPDIRRSHGRVLAHLVHDDGLRASTIADREGMTAQSIGEIVDDLERLGYVQRRPDPDDRRAKLIVATPRGAEAIAASGVIVRHLERELTTLLGPGHARLREMLLLVIQHNEGRERLSP